MLFNAPEFLFLFLPLTWAAFAALRRAGRLGAVLNLLLLASLVFYGAWEPKYLLLIGSSIVGNFTLGSLIRSSVAVGRGGGGWLALGVAANLGVLGWFKYANFAHDNLERILDLGWQLEPITLPLGISFFTFQQVAYLVDLRRGTLPPHGFRNYALFVVYFPQLIAGPIVHFRDLQPQFGPGLLATPLARRFAVGLTALGLGLGKKVLIADRLAEIATPVFRAADDGLPVSAFEAWVGALAYTFQIYFDFSGYSDMAIGLSLMFGIAVAVNFRSPYRALSITDFWRRWHITLSAFLRDYLYIPLGGNRRGPLRQKVNLMITMLLGGLWHGAGWNFMLWGGLHGGYLIAHQTVREFTWFKRLVTVPGWRPAAWSLTFLAVVLAWVPFRAEATAGSVELLRSMAFLDGFDLPSSAPIAAGLAERWITVDLNTCASLLLLALVLATRCPNTAQICGIDGGAPAWLRLAARPWQAVAVGILLAFSLLSVGQPSEFLYFNF